jgi:hypothetical protein
VGLTSEGIYTKGAQTCTQQEEKKKSGTESFILKQTYFSVNNDMQQHGNILTYDLVQCSGFQTVNSRLKMAK